MARPQETGVVFVAAGVLLAGTGLAILVGPRGRTTETLPAVGLLLLRWLSLGAGVLTLTRAKRAAPDQTWWQFLGTDVVAILVFGVAFVLVAVFPDEANAILRELLSLRDTVGIARGGR